MQCIKRRFSKQLLIERLYRKRKLDCEQFKSEYVANLESISSNLQSNYLSKSRQLGINCFKDKANLGSGYLIADYSIRLRKLNAIKQGKGTTQIRSYPLLLNEYGKREGSPGGYGSSPKNRF